MIDENLDTEEIEQEKKKLKIVTALAIIASGAAIISLVIGLTFLIDALAMAMFIFLNVAIFLWIFRKIKQKKIVSLQDPNRPKSTEEPIKEEQKIEMAKSEEEVMRSSKDKLDALKAGRIATAIVGSLLFTLSIIVLADGALDPDVEIIGAMILGLVILIFSGLLRWLRQRKLKEVPAES